MGSNNAVFDSTIEQLQSFAGLESWAEPDWQHANAGLPSWWVRLIRDLEQKQHLSTGSQKEHSAWGAAVRLGLQFRWDLEGTRLRAEVRAEYSISSTQRELFKLMEEGLTPDELLRIHQLRSLWADVTEFHAGREPWQDSTLGWETAYRVLRTLASNADVTEAERLLWQLYERWWESGSLRRRFVSFHRYLLFRLDCREDDSCFESIRPDFAGLDETGWTEDDECSEPKRMDIEKWLDKFAA